MIVPPLSQLQSQATLDALLAGVQRMPRSVFAALDGGHFDDLPGRLSGKGIAARSLFLDGAAPDIRQAGPWLVSLAEARAQALVGELLSEAPCAVFWSSPDGEQALWRHLRTINEVLLPHGRRAGDAVTQQHDGGYERVLFRHWDPNVLAAVLPILTPTQHSRFFGPCTMVVMNAPDQGGLKRAERLDPPAPYRPGLLAFDAAQIDRLETSMRHSSRLRTARFLKSHLPPHLSGVDDGFFWGATLASEQSASELGIRTERGRTRWAYVMTMSDGQAAELPEVRSYVTDGRDTPDNRIRSLIGHTVDALRSDPFPEKGRL